MCLGKEFLMTVESPRMRVKESLREVGFLKTFSNVTSFKISIFSSKELKSNLKPSILYLSGFLMKFLIAHMFSRTF